MSTELKLTRKDFQSDQEVRWCPGCGDYAILAAVQAVFPTLGIPREKFVVVSGIGCSSRFPYYMDTYGFHTIHGRAPAVATGVKLGNPDLSVWVITGDGDALSIGGNHFIHALRRNIGLKILLFNNRIYGLTKGQFSPTTPPGKRTKSSPEGSLDSAFLPLSVALGAGATFAARAVDTQAPHLKKVIARSAEHEGTALVEILQNCNIFNDGAWSFATDKPHRADMQIELEHGEPMLFGKDKEKGLRLNGLGLEIISLEDHDVSEVLVHDETNLVASFLLANLEPPFPTPIGVLRAVQADSYESLLGSAVTEAVAEGGADPQSLLNGGSTWTVE